MLSVIMETEHVFTPKEVSIWIYSFLAMWINSIIAFGVCVLSEDMFTIEPAVVYFVWTISSTLLIWCIAKLLIYRSEPPVHISEIEAPTQVSNSAVEFSMSAV